MLLICQVSNQMNEINSLKFCSFTVSARNCVYAREKSNCSNEKLGYAAVCYKTSKKTESTVPLTKENLCALFIFVFHLYAVCTHVRLIRSFARSFVWWKMTATTTTTTTTSTAHITHK